MRAITVRQPWAWAIIHGGKDVENRTRNIAGAYRGLVAIHAGKVWDHAAWGDVELASAWLSAGDDFTHLTSGAFIGVVDLVDVHADCTELVEGYGHTPTCSPWAMSDRYHLALTNPRPLPWPIPAKGRLGLWTPGVNVQAAIREQIGDLS